MVEIVKHLLSTYPGALVVLVIFGLGVIVTVIAMFVLGFRQGREVSIWPPKIGPGVAKSLPTRTEEPAGTGQETLIIHHATYGAKGKTSDVTQLLRSRTRDGALTIHVNNADLGGDPFPGGANKVLVVAYSYGGRILTKGATQCNELTLPSTAWPLNSPCEKISAR